MTNDIKEKYNKLLLIISEKYKKDFFKLFYLSILISAFEVFGLGILMTYILLISNQKELFSNEYVILFMEAFKISNNEFLILVGLIIGIIFIVKSAITLKFNHMNIVYSYKLYEYLSSRLLKKYLYMPFLLFSKRNTSDMIKIIMTDATHVSQIINKIFLAVSEVIVMFSIIVILMFIDITMVCIIIILFSVIFVIIKGQLSIKVREYGKRAVDIRADMFQNIDEVLLNTKVNRIMNREDYCINHFRLLANEYGTYSIKGLFLGVLPRYIIELFVVLFLLSTIIGLIYFNMLENYLSIMIIFLASLLRLLPSFFKFINTYNQIKYQIGAINIISKNLIIDDDMLGKDYIDYNKNIVFKNVNFTYDKELILKDINLTIEKGKKVAIIGESGSGKSTIISLISGFIYPKSGTINIDNEILSISNIKSFRSKIGYIPQDVYLIDGTIEENIILNRKYDANKLHKVINQVNLQSFINSSELGLKTKTGQNGIQISGGQKQRIGIARALYGNPELLILDEATSALNSQMEKEIMDEVFLLSKNITMLVITHKLSFINKCDSIYTLKNGNIKEVTNDYI